MTDDQPDHSEHNPKYWRKLARQTLRRAELASNPAVQRLLRGQAQDYMLKAAQLARNWSKQRT
jgi:hypothetical protein